MQSYQRVKRFCLIETKSAADQSILPKWKNCKFDQRSLCPLQRLFLIVRIPRAHDSSCNLAIFTGYPSPLSLPQIKFERIDGVILRGTVWQLCCHLPELLAEPVHPCSATSACELHCNISDTIRAGGEDACVCRNPHPFYLAD
jgi:hypothetical protein